MKKIFLFATLLFIVKLSFAQLVYKGTIDKYPIEMAFSIYGNQDIRGAYAYDKYDIPIAVIGEKTKNTLILFELDARNVKQAKIQINQFIEGAQTLNGTWTDLNTGKVLTFSLQLQYNLNTKESKLTNVLLMQAQSLPIQYFKVILSKAKADYEPRVKGLNMYEKGTDRLVQTFDLDCQAMGINSIDIDDFNFDGHNDFSVFEGSYAGPNTSRLYYLYNPQTKRYFLSDITGISLEFDPSSKTISETNQCCAGSVITTSTYTIVNNKMVLQEQHCYKRNEATDDMEERKWEACQ